MAIVNSRRDFLALKWRIFRHGPNEERAFGLIAGLVVAASIVFIAFRARDGALDRYWLVLAVTLLGTAWIFGPLLLPGSSPVLDPQWFRTYPRPTQELARAMAPSQLFSVGAVITLIALSSFPILGFGGGASAIAIGIISMVAQAFFLIWAGRCVSAGAARLLASPAGGWLMAFQMSVLLAISFAGWVPLAALILPDLEAGSTEVLPPDLGESFSADTERIMLLLPTGWGLAAVFRSTAETSSYSTIIASVTALTAVGACLRYIWIRMTASALTTPPARAQSGYRVDARRRRRTRPRGALWGVFTKEIKTWFRDPHRRLDLAHAWMTPILMILLVAPTSWHFALPYIGVFAAVIGAMAAVNTYALDGTAVWQILTTPRAIAADVRGRAAAWLLLFGAPACAGTLILGAVSGSTFSAPALSMTLAAVGLSSAGCPLVSLLIPAVGTDARSRISAAGGAGNAAGGQWTAFTIIGFFSFTPLILISATGLAGNWPTYFLVGLAAGATSAICLIPASQRYLQLKGPRLIDSFSSGDPTRAR